MASTGSRRAGSRRSHEKSGSKGDDPWCVVCDVNLALDGRTFTVVSSHQNSELCDVFLRVLAMTFSHDHAFVNVCNRCERQLKRLGRTTSIAMARQEGRKFRQQIEGHVAKHGLQGVELGDFRNTPVTAVSSKPQKGGLSSSSGVLRRGDTLEETSSVRKGREMYSRSNSSVRVEDKDSGKRGAYNRDLSAPERKVQARDLHYSANESSDKGKEVRRATRSSVQPTSAERTPSFRPISDDAKTTADRRSKSAIASHQRGPPSRDGKLSVQKINSVDQPKMSSKLTIARAARDTSKLGIGQSQSDRQKQPGNTENNTSKEGHEENNDIYNDSWELSSGELNPFTADIEREHSQMNTADIVDEHTSERIQHAFREYRARDSPIMAEDDHFIQTERAVFMESSQSSQSSNEAIDNPEKDMADLRSTSPETEQGEDAKTSPTEDDNVSPAEELAAEDENKDRTKRLRVTFSETVGADVSDEAVSRTSAQPPQARPDTDKGDSQDSWPLIAETEDNREQQKDVEDFQGREATDEQQVQPESEVRDTAGGEGQDWQEEEHGLIEADRIQQNNAAVVSETEDLVELELTTSSSFLRHDPDSQSSSETPWLYSVSKVIQVTHLEPPVQLDDVDLKGVEEQTMVKNSADPNGSQVSLQPMQEEGVSATKSEASPLIDKDEGKDDKNSLKGRDSKFKDQQPGLPCCTIL